MFVVCCHPEHDPFAFIDRVPRLERETEETLRVWRGSHKSRNLSSTGSLQSVNDVCGGKQVETCAADQIAELTSHEDFLMVASPLAHPVPLRPLPDQFVPVMHDEDDSDDSEAGFWDSRFDWYERAQRHLQVRAGQLAGATTIRLPGNDVQGWVSTHPLLGAVRFGLKLPRATRSIYIGALDAGRSGIRS